MCGFVLLFADEGCRTLSEIAASLACLALVRATKASRIAPNCARANRSRCVKGSMDSRDMGTLRFTGIAQRVVQRASTR